MLTNLYLMTFESVSQFHIDLLWVNVGLAYKCLNSVLNVKAVVASFN